MATPLPLPLSPLQAAVDPTCTSTLPLSSTTAVPADKTKPASTSTSTSTSTTAHDRSQLLPRDARLIALLLAANGASDAEPAVMTILVEFAHRKLTRAPYTSSYTADILSDALVYAEHARGQPLNPSGAVVNLVPSIEDVRLAVQAKQESNSIPKEFLLDLATQINSNPLPPVPEVYGIRLPPQAQRLTAPNFSIVPRSEKGAVPPPKEPPFESLRVGQSELERARGMRIGAVRDEGEGEGEGEGLFGSDDDDDEDDEEEEVPIQGQASKMNGEPEQEEDDDDDDDDDGDGDDDDDEDEEMEEVAEFENTPRGGTAAEGDGDDDEEDDDDD